MSLFGDSLVDMIWSVDAALDEVLSDAKLTLSAVDSATPEVANKAKAAKQCAENDKESLQAIVKRLLVRVIYCFDTIETDRGIGTSDYHPRVV